MNRLKEYYIPFLQLIVVLSLVSVFSLSTLSQEVVNGLSATQVEFNDLNGNPAGTFRINIDGTWSQDSTTEQNLFSYQESNRDEWSVYLYDPTRELIVSLDLWKKEIYFGENVEFLVSSASSEAVVVNGTGVTPEEPVVVEPINEEDIIGAVYRLTLYKLDVLDASDDGEVGEIYGNIQVDGQPVWGISETEAVEMPNDSTLLFADIGYKLDEFSIDKTCIFSEEKECLFVLSGAIMDSDDGLGQTDRNVLLNSIMSQGEIESNDDASDDVIASFNSVIAPQSLFGAGTFTYSGPQTEMLQTIQYDGRNSYQGASTIWFGVEKAEHILREVLDVVQQEQAPELAEAPRIAFLPTISDFVVHDPGVKNFGEPVNRIKWVDLKPALNRICSKESFPYYHDGTEYHNYKKKNRFPLPVEKSGYYTEYVVPTYSRRKKIINPGPQRLVLGAGGVVWYTPDHYESFVFVANSYSCPAR